MTMPKKEIIIPILEMPAKPSHVLEMVAQQTNTLNALGTSGDNLVDPADLIIQKANNADLYSKEILAMAKGGLSNKIELRDLTYELVYNDRKSNMDLVEKAAIAKNDPMLAKDLIVRNGYRYKGERSPIVRSDVWVVNKKNTPGVVIGKSKSPGKNSTFSMDWGYSLDGGLTWISLHSTAVCSIEIPNLISGSKIIVRRRFVIGKNEPEGWVQSAPLTVL